MSALAITMSGMAIGSAFSRPATTATAPHNVDITLEMGLTEVVTAWNDTCQCVVQLDTPAADREIIGGEYLHWAPSSIVIQHGDTVTLTIVNPRDSDHGFMIMASPDDFSGTTVVPLIKGTEDGGAGSSATITFTALKPGTYVFMCPLPFDEAAEHCHPDHETLTGTLIVL